MIESKLMETEAMTVKPKPMTIDLENPSADVGDGEI
jgi:hypothetical protein